MQTVTITGARLRLVINNKVVGLATSISYSVDYGKKALRGIDTPFPQEIVPGQQTVKGTIACIRIQGMSLESYGIVSPQLSTVTTPLGEGAPSPGTPATGLLADSYISIALIDRITGEAVFQADQASVLSQNWSVGARGIMQGSFEFEGVVQPAQQ